MKKGKINIYSDQMPADAISPENQPGFQAGNTHIDSHIQEKVMNKKIEDMKEILKDFLEKNIITKDKYDESIKEIDELSRI